ncbi:hypothetical protein [Microbulbifer sp. JMSA008]|uniref:hypothetical protein n=1 Tax=Microbulbifer sp. JMSA008 TaxID=3243373 RepID=UPI004039F3A1
MQTYRNRPDVFELVVGERFLSKISIKHLEYPFAISEEEYCYFNDVLIGEMLGKAEISKYYYEGLQTSYKGRIVISLTPMITKNEYLVCPEYEDFNQALSSLLKVASDYVLICEADCEQYEVKENPDLVKMLGKLEGFCKGEYYDCPTFIYRAEM